MDRTLWERLQQQARDRLDYAVEAYSRRPGRMATREGALRAAAADPVAVTHVDFCDFHFGLKRQLITLDEVAPTVFAKKEPVLAAMEEDASGLRIDERENRIQALGWHCGVMFVPAAAYLGEFALAVKATRALLDRALNRQHVGVVYAGSHLVPGRILERVPEEERPAHFTLKLFCMYAPLYALAICVSQQRAIHFWEE